MSFYLNKIFTSEQAIFYIESPCITATNLSEEWRADHDASDIKGGGPNTKWPGYACDLRESLQWFRFNGGAGNFWLFIDKKVIYSYASKVLLF